MQISHILRADEWLASTPRHILLYHALDWEPPQFAHLPIILGPDRTKLSKRHGATSLIEYRKQGYLPEAVVNFLALLGWSLDDKTEIISREELIRHFSVERLGKTAAIFNIDKFNWMNGVYIRCLDIDDLTQRAIPFLEKGLPCQVDRPISRDYVRQIMPLIQERVKLLGEIPQLVDFFFINELDYNTNLLLAKGMSKETASRALATAQERLGMLNSFDPASVEALLRPLSEELGLKAGEFFGLLRVVTTGRTAAPPLFHTMSVLGKERCQKRIKAALAKLHSSL
jgi:glutamyl-tRNA synthetase